jgi:serine/threonine protein kinase
MKDDIIHFVLECAKMDLMTAIQNNILSNENKKKIMLDILLGIDFMHKNKIMHRDLKPGNILLFHDNSNIYNAKICDFGLSKNYTRQDTQSPEVVTVIYRPPEICLNIIEYGPKIDIWSLGCIFYEMITGINFIYGSRDSDDYQLLAEIMESHYNDNCKNELFELATIYKKENIINNILINGKKIILQSHKSKNKELYQKLIKNNKWNILIKNNPYNDDFINLLSGMLEISPCKRLHMDDILKHPFFSEYNDKISDTLKITEELCIKNNIINNININDLDERTKIVNIAFTIMKENANNYWFKPRIIFQSIDLYDRWLSFPDRNNDEYKIYHNNDNNIYICYFVCLYLSMKLFTSTMTLPRYTDCIPDELKQIKCMKMAEEWEKLFITKILDYQIYRESIFENLSNDIDRINIHHYLSHTKKVNGINIKRLCELYQLSKSIYIKS